MNVVLRDLDLHCQGQTFSCYAFAEKKIAQPADVQRDCLDSHGPRHGVAVVVISYQVINH